MKTLLIPTLTFALACLPALGQEIAAPNATPAPAGASFGSTPKNSGIATAHPTADVATPISPILPDTIKLAEATINEATQYLNRMLEKMGAEPLNVVVEAELSDLRVPSMTLRNVSAIDVLKVITKVSGLSLEPVSSSSGRTAAWVITRPKVNASLAGVTLGLVDGGLEAREGSGAGGAAESGGGSPGSASTPAAEVPAIGRSANPPPTGVPNLAGVPILGRLFTGSGSSTKGTAGNVVWVDAAAGTPASAQVTRVLATGRYYLNVNEAERAEHEANLVAMLQDVTEEQKLHCTVRLYPGLHVIVVKGSPEGVDLIEQTLSALKENLNGGAPSYAPRKPASR